ncbi:LysR family transcriptional regulator [Enterococcus casseliflavus]|uniref:LysR family transcriptional regulator n=1 Tax=Enterococcus casseliflavus TaxID=37734 RepID=UPI0035D61DD5
MDFIKELQSFKTIVEEGTFTRAAAKLNYAQSTVTNHIKKLEDELEVALFLEGKSNVLTLEGELLKQEVPELIAHWERVKEQLINASHTVEYSLRMGILQPYDILVLPALLHDFSQHYPKINFEIVVGSTLELANALNENRIDFTLCSLPHEKHFAYEELFQEELCCITSISNPLIINELADLEGSHLYRSNSDCPARTKIESYLDNQVPSIHWESVSNISTIPYLIERTGYCSLIPRSIIEQTHARVKIVSLPLPDPHMSIGLLSKHPLMLSPSITKNFVVELKMRLLSLL